MSSKQEDNLPMPSAPTAATTFEVSRSVKQEASKGSRGRSSFLKRIIKGLKHNSNDPSTLTQEGASANTSAVSSSNNTVSFSSTTRPSDDNTAVRRSFLPATRLQKVTPKMSVDHFRLAQQSEWSGFEVALQEIQQGCKRGCWMWYIFPQIAGLGQSSMSQRFSIQNRAHAFMYLDDKELCGNLLEMTRAVAIQIRRGATIKQLVSWDQAKLISSLTLFEIVANEAAGVNHAKKNHESSSLEELSSLCRSILQMICSEDGYSRCQHTLDALSRDDA